MPQVLFYSLRPTCLNFSPQNIGDIKRMDLNNPLKGDAFLNYRNSDKTFQKESLSERNCD